MGADPHHRVQKSFVTECWIHENLGLPWASLPPDGALPTSRLGQVTCWDSWLLQGVPAPSLIILSFAISHESEKGPESGPQLEDYRQQELSGGPCFRGLLCCVNRPLGPPQVKVFLTNLCHP